MTRALSEALITIDKVPASQGRLLYGALREAGVVPNMVNGNYFISVI